MELNQEVTFDGGKWTVVETQARYCRIRQGTVTKWVHDSVLDIPTVSPVRHRVFKTEESNEVKLSLSDPAITFTLINMVSVERGEDRRLPCCEYCGHEIKHLFILKDSQGRRLVVGSECVVTLLSGQDLKRAQDGQKNLRKAVKQWKDQKPAPLPGESRVDYLNRRVAEMQNSPRARRELALLRNLYLKARSRLSEAGLVDPSTYYRPMHYQDPEYPRMGVSEGHLNDSEYHCPLCQQRKAIREAYNQAVSDEQDQILREIAVKHQANPFDFYGKEINGHG